MKLTKETKKIINNKMLKSLYGCFDRKDLVERASKTAIRLLENQKEDWFISSSTEEQDYNIYFPYCFTCSYKKLLEIINNKKLMNISGRYYNDEAVGFNDLQNMIKEFISEDSDKFVKEYPINFLTQETDYLEVDYEFYNLKLFDPEFSFIHKGHANILKVFYKVLGQCNYPEPATVTVNGVEYYREEDNLEEFHELYYSEEYGICSNTNVDKDAKLIRAMNNFVMINKKVIVK